MQELILNPVKFDDYKFLYDLLAERCPDAYISHTVMPTWDEHVEFNKKKPYSEDYIIWSGNNRIGRLYITRNREIGIFFTKSAQGKGYGTKILKDLIKNGGGTYFANISPRNTKSQRFFEKLGFRLVQYTYKYEGIH